MVIAISYTQNLEPSHKFFNERPCGKTAGKNQVLTFLFALFSVLTARRGASSRRSVVALNSVASFTGRGNSKNMDCARHKQIYMCLPRPPCARTNPRRF